MPQKLRDAIEVVNTTRRGPYDPPLVKLAQCAECAGAFAMLPQDFSRAEIHGHPTLCRPCSIERRRAKRRVGGKRRSK